MELRLGTILVDKGILTEDQVKAVLNVQQRTGRPFGLICEQMYDVAPKTIEAAWAEQYSARATTLDPRLLSPERAALDVVSRRQAWQFNVLPVQWDGRELMMATTPAGLCRALRFATNVLGVPAYFVMCEPVELQDAMQMHYPMPGTTLDGRRKVA